ncbi:GntR family transcriptional regulator [Escherichia coli]|nr:GntR family transcriptional regulator [Escherichia coli]
MIDKRLGHTINQSGLNSLFQWLLKGAKVIFQKDCRLLKSEINGNSWHVGDLLPSEAELAVRYNVSRNTLRKALSLLEGEGIIHRKHGSERHIQRIFVAH